jgi:hypothetical protein
VTVSFMFMSSCIGTSSNLRKRIKGEWCLYTQQVNYPKIVFSLHNGVILMSAADTVYSYKYHLKKNTLGIIVSLKDTVYHRILKKTKDSLILGSFLENQEIQRYFRCEMVESPSLK